MLIVLLVFYNIISSLDDCNRLSSTVYKNPTFGELVRVIDTDTVYYMCPI